MGEAVDRSLEEVFREGIANGEWFEVVYNGGSNPGSKRRIAPIALLPGGKVRARCYSSNAVKPFFLNKMVVIEIGSDSTDVTEWTDKPAPSLPRYSDVRDVHVSHLAELQTAGWAVELQDDEFGWSLALIGSFKNGKRRKTPTHVLAFQHTAADLVGMPDGSMVYANHRPRIRPWIYLSKTYADCTFPVAAFLEAATAPLPVTS